MKLQKTTKSTKYFIFEFLNVWTRPKSNEEWSKYKLSLAIVECIELKWQENESVLLYLYEDDSKISRCFVQLVCKIKEIFEGK